MRPATWQELLAILSAQAPELGGVIVVGLFVTLWVAVVLREEQRAEDA